MRQLANCIVRLVVLAQGPDITVSDLPEFLKDLRLPRALPAEHHPSEMHTEDRTLDEVDRQVIMEAMEKFRWNQTRAASYLGVTRKVLSGRLERYGIKKPGYPTRQRNRELSSQRLESELRSSTLFKEAIIAVPP